MQSRVLEPKQRAIRQTSRLSVALAASVVLLASFGAGMRAGQAPAASGQTAAAAQPPRMPQGGRGALKVLVITRGHEFDREPFFQMFDALGNDITWTHVEHPAADVMLAPENAKDFDVVVFYDLAGPGVRHNKPDGSFERTYPPPSPEEKKNFTALVKSGKGLVFLHHSIAGYAHTWPEYSEVIGGACDWYWPVTVRGVDHPKHGYFGNTQQHITVADKTHPVTQGLGDGFNIVDEAYACAFFEDSVHPLLRTDFQPPDHDKYLNPKWPFSNLAGWVKTSEISPIVYLQNGHGPTAWANEDYRKLLLNAMKWAGSPEALDWAKAHPTKIFK